MLSGVHLPNRPLRSDDFALIQRGAFQSARLFWYHHPTDVPSLRAAGIQHFTVRLPDIYEIPHLPGPGNRIPGHAAWARIAFGYIQMFHQQGVTDFTVGNEPNAPGHPYGHPAEGWDYQSVMRDAVLDLDGMLFDAGLRGQVRLGLPPLSYAPGLWGVMGEWKKAFLASPGGLQPYVSLFAFAGANVYWTSARQREDPSYGKLYQDVHSWTGLPITITEYGNSMRDLVPHPTLQQIELAMLRDYPVWLEETAAVPYVDSCHLFMLSGTSDWTGFFPTLPVLSAIAGVRL